MRPAVIPADEADRLATLVDLEILDTAFEPVFGELVELASFIAHTPIAAMTLVDSDRQWFKSSIGLEVTETERDVSFCAHVVADERTIVVPDARRDERFAENPLVTGELGIRFYAGAPLLVDDHYVGSLCVIDRRPRTFLSDERRALEILARQASSQLDLRRRRRADPPR